MGVLSSLLTIRTRSDPSHSLGKWGGGCSPPIMKNMNKCVQNCEFMHKNLICISQFTPNLCSDSCYVSIFHNLKYPFIYFCWTWPTRWVNIIEAYPNAASDNDMKGSPLAAFFNVPNTMIFINMYRNCCKADGAEQGIKNSSSKIRTGGLKHKPHIWCNAALLMMWCYKGTCGITRLMSQGQLRYFKSWDWDAAPYE